MTTTTTPSLHPLTTSTMTKPPPAAAHPRSADLEPPPTVPPRTEKRCRQELDRTQATVQRTQNTLAGIGAKQNSPKSEQANSTEEVQKQC
ncbi:hypothetical protein P8452_33145 [Trifolium repens]|nr:hypothetical protein P8452_33145 [Trifolium repens]